MTGLNLIDLDYQFRMLKILGFRLNKKLDRPQRKFPNILRLLVLVCTVISLIGLTHFLVHNLNSLVLAADNVKNIFVILISLVKIMCINIQQERLENLIKDVTVMTNKLDSIEFTPIIESSILGRRLTKLFFCCTSFIGILYILQALYLTFYGSPKFPLNFS